MKAEAEATRVKLTAFAFKQTLSLFNNFTAFNFNISKTTSLYCFVICVLVMLSTAMHKLMNHYGGEKPTTNAKSDIGISDIIPCHTRSKNAIIRIKPYRSIVKLIF